MRIVVSGTHASGKSTLVSDFARRHPDFTVLPDPFELIDESWDAPSAASFAAQLRLSAVRLDPREAPDELIAERGPLDFLAYLAALEATSVDAGSRELWERSVRVTAEALANVDLIVVLPLNAVDGIAAGADEDEALRGAMNDALLDLIDDPDLVGDSTQVVEITGDRMQRLARLEAVSLGGA
ncbi:hypothetical protein GCM10009775_05810 [Microbacterium aoyamense]|uniref:NadR/Ttd14 AAA domain-containing protein n=1 Tax=Microbacterium aoyamense TaxID=344166 RepID=A0ABN2P9N5_9MICO|nr:AAA family ATPase [Microbacterium aoyamense]